MSECVYLVEAMVRLVGRGMDMLDGVHMEQRHWVVRMSGDAGCLLEYEVIH